MTLEQAFRDMSFFKKAENKAESVAVNFNNNQTT